MDKSAEGIFNIPYSIQLPTCFHGWSNSAFLKSPNLARFSDIKSKRTILLLTMRQDRIGLKYQFSTSEILRRAHFSLLLTTMASPVSAGKLAPGHDLHWNSTLDFSAQYRSSLGSSRHRNTQITVQLLLILLITLRTTQDIQCHRCHAEIVVNQELSAMQMLQSAINTGCRGI